MGVVHFDTKESVQAFDDWETMDQLMFHTKEAVAELLQCKEELAEEILELTLDNGETPTDSALEYYKVKLEVSRGG